MPNIRPFDLPPATEVPSSAAFILDTGAVVQKATAEQIVDSAIPLATQAEAETGFGNDTRMSPLRVQQAINAQALSPDFLSGPDGAALVGLEQGGTVANAVRWVTPQMFGAVGDGVADDLPALAAAVTRAAALGVRLYLPGGIYGVSDEWKLPDNADVFGDGEDVTIIRMLASQTDLNKHTVTNASNTRNYLTNTGNRNIKLSNLTIDGNGRRTGADGTGDYYTGCALQFSFVEHFELRNVTGINGNLHCIDIAAAGVPANVGDNYAESGSTNEDYTRGPSRYGLLENVTAHDPVKDDGITVHYSRNITLINPVAVWEHPTQVPGPTQQGVEIDEGCRSVTVVGGNARNFTKGLQIKGHADTPAASDVVVIGFEAEGCGENFSIEHSTLTSTTGRNVTLIGCKSIRPVLRGGLSEARFMNILSCSGVKIENFHIDGDPAKTTDAEAGVLLLSQSLRHSEIDGLFIKNVNRPSGVVRATSTIGAGVKISNVHAEDCYGPIGYLTASGNGITANDWYAETANTGSPQPGVIKLNAGTVTHAATRIENIRANAGFTSAAVDEDGADSIAMPLGTGTLRGNQTTWVKANSAGGVAGTPQDVDGIGYLGGNQNIGAGETILRTFKSRVKNGTTYTVGYIGAFKVSTTDSDTGHDVIIGTRTNADGGSGATTRLRVRHNGGIQINEGPLVLTGAGTPEGVITAPVGSQFMRTDGGASTTFYVKESGTGNTGWVAK